MYRSVYFLVFSAAVSSFVFGPADAFRSSSSFSHARRSLSLKNRATSGGTLGGVLDGLGGDVGGLLVRPLPALRHHPHQPPLLAPHRLPRRQRLNTRQHPLCQHRPHAEACWVWALAVLLHRPLVPNVTAFWVLVLVAPLLRHRSRSLLRLRPRRQRRRLPLHQPVYLHRFQKALL
ncbi:hypothetical protein F5I97DRAFT_1333750 [Phlebopus sp. FC_14]|nr:hypothetical protein F5I97DRAFT_1333750 [Phlebopus sp. FC_14]